MIRSTLYPYRCVVVDDDIQFVFLLSRYIKEVPKLRLFNTFLTSQAAIDGVLEKDEIDILFLDIRMGTISGLEIARRLRDKVKYIIFISATREFALEALQLGGDYYLVKPIHFEEFLQVVNKVLHRQKRILKSK